HLQPDPAGETGVPGGSQAGRFEPALAPRAAHRCAPAAGQGRGAARRVIMNPQPDFAINVEGLSKSFDGKTVVHDLTLRVARGQICGFLGPNGSGKTTTIRMLCGLLKPDSGSGTCLGYDVIRETDEIKRHIGYMTQKFGRSEGLTIQETLQFTARVYGLDRRNERVATALERLGLHHRRHQLAGALSGGWKQRLALAACLLHEPQLLLLDEPTAG